MTSKVRVAFRSRYSLDADMTLAIIGSGEAFGCWSTRKPVYAHLSGQNEWVVVMELEPGSTIYWSWVILNSRGEQIRRESKPRRRRLHLGADHVTVMADWNQPMAIQYVYKDKKIPTGNDKVGDADIKRDLNKFSIAVPNLKELAKYAMNKIESHKAGHPNSEGDWYGDKCHGDGKEDHNENVEMFYKGVKIGAVLVVGALAAVAVKNWLL